MLPLLNAKCWASGIRSSLWILINWFTDLVQTKAKFLFCSQIIRFTLASAVKLINETKTKIIIFEWLRQSFIMNSFRNGFLTPFFFLLSYSTSPHCTNNLKSKRIRGLEPFFSVGFHLILLFFFLLACWIKNCVQLIMDDIKRKKKHIQKEWQRLATK